MAYIVEYYYIRRPPFLQRRNSSILSLLANSALYVLGFWCSAKEGPNKLIKDQRERHCTLSGRFRGTGTAVTYLWGKGLWAFAAVSEEDEVSATSACPRPWNLAKRLIMENFSISWVSSLKSNIDALLSKLHHMKAFETRRWMTRCHIITQQQST